MGEIGVVEVGGAKDLGGFDLLMGFKNRGGWVGREKEMILLMAELAGEHLSLFLSLHFFPD